MFDDERPDEPDHPYPEPDPESDLPDPASDLGPDPPEPPTPGADLPDEGDVDGDLLVAFWALVALANVALLGLAAGGMLLALTDRTDLALALLAVGAAATVFGVGRYRRARAAQEAADGPDADELISPALLSRADASRTGRRRRDRRDDRGRRGRLGTAVRVLASRLRVRTGGHRVG